MSKHTKPLCKWGKDCYQRNKHHLEKYEHPTAKIDKQHHKRAISPASSESENTKGNAKTKRARHDSNNPLSPTKNDCDSRSTRSRSTESSGSNESSDTELTPSKQNKVRQLLPIIISPPANNGHSTNNTQCNNLSDGPTPEQDIDFINDVFDRETMYSQRAEYKEMLKNPEIFIKHKFLVEMPKDFYSFWSYCKENIKNDQKPENKFSKFGLTLMGPFDVMAGKFTDAQMFEPGDYLRHCRYFYDPPEFQTIFKKDKTGIHYGYWRDSPTDTNCFIAKNDFNKGCEITLIADNIFSAIIHFLDKDVGLTPFNRSSANSIKKSLEDWAKKDDIKLDNFSNQNRARNLKIVTKTFHKAGLVVPVQKKTQIGYRELQETDANLKKILNLLNGNEDNDEVEQSVINEVMDKLQPLITAANIAVDECDFGNSIELGIDFFCHGSKHLHGVLLRLLVNGYTMVHKPQFVAIVKAHLEKRKYGTDVSIL